MEFNILGVQGILVLLIVGSTRAVPPVCSTLGGLCQNTVDCCRGCCEGHTCVDRPYSCSPDLVAIPGRNSCEKYFCAPGEFCFLAEICPPENPCPPQPFCRRATGSGYNHTYSAGRNSVGPLQPIVVLLFVMINMPVLILIGTLNLAL